MQDYDELAKDPQILHNGIFTEVNIQGTSVKMVKHPVAFDKETPEIHHLALSAGDDSREILKEVGFTPSDIQGFEDEGVIRCGANVNSKEACVVP